MANKQRFRVVLEGVKGTEALVITIPFNVEEVFGTRARVPVKGTINGFAFRSSIFPEGNGVHYMAVNKAMREGAKVRAGDRAEFVMERDDAPRIITPPKDFARALKANKAASARWQKLSYTNQKEYVKAIEEAKKPETRTRRIEKAMAELSVEKKPKG